MGAHAGGAVHDGALDHFCTARVDVLDREFALHRRDRGNGLSHAAMVMPAAAEQAGFIQINVGIHEAGQGQFAADLDLGRLASEPWRDGGDPPAADADIDRGGRGPRPDVAEDEVEGGFAFMGPSWLGLDPKPSRRAAAGQLQIVCSSEASLFKICACSLVGRLSYCPSGEIAMSIAAKAKSKGMSDAEVVEAYLTASMIPDPDAAAAYMKPGTIITFTGGREFDHPRGPTGFNARRYRSGSRSRWIASTSAQVRKRLSSTASARSMANGSTARRRQPLRRSFRGEERPDR